MRSVEQIVVRVLRISSRSGLEAPFISMMTLLLADTGCEAMEAELLFRCGAFREVAVSGRGGLEDCSRVLQTSC
jgi:hypothetical protein